MSGSRTKQTGVGGGVKRARLPSPVQALRFSGVWACWNQTPDPDGFVAPTPKWAAGPPLPRVLADAPRNPSRSKVGVTGGSKAVRAARAIREGQAMS
eukprot:4725209-Amphidinium_carterae.1